MSRRSAPAWRKGRRCAAAAPARRRRRQALGAELALVTVVQKVSNLILSITLSVLEAAPSAARRAVYSADIRGNTDESWQRGLRWLLRNRLLPRRRRSADRRATWPEV